MGSLLGPLKRIKLSLLVRSVTLELPVMFQVVPAASVTVLVLAASVRIAPVSCEAAAIIVTTAGAPAFWLALSRISVVADDRCIRGRDVRHPALHGEGVGRRADLRTDERERVCYAGRGLEKKTIGPGSGRGEAAAGHRDRCTILQEGAAAAAAVRNIHGETGRVDAAAGAARHRVRFRRRRCSER